MKLNHFFSRFPWLMLAWMLYPHPGLGQSTPLLQLIGIEADPPASVEFRFSDAGTGATNYAVEFSSTVGAEADWKDVPALISSLGEGEYQVVIVDTEEPAGYYRVRGLGAVITASFTSAAFQVLEGGTVSPVIELSAPFVGYLRYRLSGTAASGDYIGLSGEVYVNGTSVALPVEFADDAEIGQLRHLTLSLESEGGLILGARSETTISIEENDAEWQGSVRYNDTTLGFIVRIQISGDAIEAVLQGDGFGFFPASSFPAAITFSDESFELMAENIPVAARDTALNLPMLLTLELNALNSSPNESVERERVEGSASLLIEVPDHPHLTTLSQGSFLLLKPPVLPSTNAVPLDPIP